MKSIRLVTILLLVVMAAFLSLAGRCFYLQQFRRDYFNSICLRQQQKLVTQQPQRGQIVDCRGRVLAASNKFLTVKAEPRIIKDRSRVAAKLAPVLNLEAIEIYNRIMQSRNPGYAKLSTNATVEQGLAASRIYGVGAEWDWQRHYPMGRLAGHVVGFTSRDNRGLAGVELEFDKELRGLAGEDIFLADVCRRPICLKQEKAVLSDGLGVILTLDATIQQFVRSELLKEYESFQAESAVAIVAEPRTGAILAMVCLPDFDPCNPGLGDANNLRNRAVTDQFEPGSVFKPIVAAVALDSGLVDRREEIFCEDGHYSGRGFGSISEYNNHRYGNLTPREILVKSSNIGMAKMGQRVGREKLYRGLSLFGFGGKTEIDVPGEVTGVLRPPGQWTGYSVTRIPFGQEITVTAVQLVEGFCILANGGRSVQPHVVKATIDTEGRVIRIKRPGGSAVGFVISPEVAKWTVREALVGVVNEGTGKKARLNKWQVFGKTGTANIANAEGGGYSDTDYVASFVGGAPAEDPAVIVLVSVWKPNKRLGKGYTGGAVAAPVVGRILEKTLTYLGVPEQKT